MINSKEFKTKQEWKFLYITQSKNAILFWYPGGRNSCQFMVTYGRGCLLLMVEELIWIIFYVLLPLPQQHPKTSSSLPNASAGASVW